MKDLLKIPNGCCELTNIPNTFKVMRDCLSYIPKKHTSISILMGSGFTYNGEITHKSAQYVYVYLY